jgi:hypothetical protein
MNAKVYLSARFAGSPRTYTYHAEGVEVRPGDTAEVETARGVARVEVMSVGFDAPEFATKPILRIVRDEESAA